MNFLHRTRGIAAALAVTLAVSLPLSLALTSAADARIGGDYSRCADLDYSRRVVSAYLQRYAPQAWASGDVETLARIHNGGPRGDRKPATVNYGKKVLRLSR